MSKENLIVLSGDDGDIEVEVIEQTVIDGITYLLVADVLDEVEDDEGDCYILKEISVDGEEVSYEVVPFEEAEGIFDAFNDMLKEEIDLIK